MKYKTLVLFLCCMTLHIQASIQAIVFAAGKSTRFDSDTPKLLTHIGKQAMVLYPVKAAAQLDMPITMVIGFKKELVKQEIVQALPQHDITFTVQDKQLGTGHALQCTKEFWHADDILIMNGDHPLTNAKLLQHFIDEHKKTNAQFSILTAQAEPNCAYGRIVKKDGVTRIVEAVDFKKNPEDYPLVNAGFYLISRTFLEEHIDKLWLHTNKNEYYITDLIEIASKHNVDVNLVHVPFDYVYGVNTQEEFLHAQTLLQKHIQ
ncbi:MAG: NTP transferase domain-containing protein [Candidatus Dependentiae bacterium]